MRSAVTISLVPEARGGPFVFWDDLDAACGVAAGLAFDAVEIFPPHGYDHGNTDILRERIDDNGLRLAAVGTGAGWVKHKLTLTSPDAAVRQKARDFVRSVIDFAGSLDAPAIIGSMQGRWGETVTREDALGWLGDALADLGAYARQYDTVLLYEPLNRYETNLVNRLDEGVALLKGAGTTNVKLLADLFHMNIEEQDLAKSIRAAGERWIGHVHLADSNRRPAGCGHTDFGAVAAALREVGYAGYLSAECLPYPNSDEAARQTIDSFYRHFRGE